MALIAPSKPPLAEHNAGPGVNTTRPSLIPFKFKFNKCRFLKNPIIIIYSMCTEMQFVL